jgi:hypothetical protein
MYANLVFIKNNNSIALSGVRSLVKKQVAEIKQCACSALFRNKLVDIKKGTMNIYRCLMIHAARTLKQAYLLDLAKRKPYNLVAKN